MTITPAVVEQPTALLAGRISYRPNGVGEWFRAPVLGLTPIAQPACVALYVALDHARNSLVRHSALAGANAVAEIDPWVLAFRPLLVAFAAVARRSVDVVCFFSAMIRCPFKVSALRLGLVGWLHILPGRFLLSAALLLLLGRPLW